MVEVQAPIHINRKSRYRNALKTRPNKVRSVLPVKERLLSLKKVNLFSAALNSRGKVDPGCSSTPENPLGSRSYERIRGWRSRASSSPLSWEAVGKTTVFGVPKKFDSPQDACVYSKLLC